MKKKKSAFWWLLMIPVQGIFSVPIVIAGILGDVIFWDNFESTGQGHPAPAFTILGMLVAIGLFVIVTIISIIITVVKAKKAEKDM